MFSSVFIFQLYNEVQARRGANDITTDNQKNGNGLFAPSHHSKNHPGAIPVPHHYSNGCNYSPSGYSYPACHQNGYGYCHANSEIGDLLQDYLGQGKQMSRKNNGARHVVSKGISLLYWLMPHSVGICTSEETGYVDMIRGFSWGSVRNILITVSWFLVVCLHRQVTR